MILFNISATLASQICVVHSVQQGPIIAEYGVTGTTYAPEGVVFDSSGIQVFIF